MTVAKLENMCMISSLKNGKRYAEWGKLYSLAVVTTGENNCVLQMQCSDHKLLCGLPVVTIGEKNCVLQIQCSDHKLLYSLAVVAVREFAFTSDCLFPTPDQQLHTVPGNADTKTHWLEAKQMFHLLQTST